MYILCKKLLKIAQTNAKIMQITPKSDGANNAKIITTHIMKSTMQIMHHERIYGKFTEGSGKGVILKSFSNYAHCTRSRKPSHFADSDGSFWPAT